MNKQSITFSASEQTLEKLTGDDQFASNTVSYVEATFTLGTNWAGFDSVRAVWKSQHYEISMVLDQYGKCDVPAEVMYYKSKVFVNLVGVSTSGDEITDRLTTYPILAFTIDSDSAVEGTETTDITPSQFDQFVSQVSDDAAAAAASAADAEAAAASLTVDSALSTSSTNPVQNKVITGAVNDLKEELSGITRNLYSFEKVTSYSSLERNGDTITNTNTDSKTFFRMQVSILDASMNNIITSNYIDATEPKKLTRTLTPASDGKFVRIKHNGSTRDLQFVFQCDTQANKPYTFSTYVAGVNPSVIGGLILTQIQFEQNSEATTYIPNITAVDYIAREVGFALEPCLNGSRYITVENGGISAGIPDSSIGYIRSSDFIRVHKGDVLTISPSAFSIYYAYIYKYSVDNSNGYYESIQIPTISAGGTWQYTFSENCWMKFKASNASGGAVITPQDLFLFNDVFHLEHLYDSGELLHTVDGLSLDYDTINSNINGNFNLAIQTDTHMAKQVGYTTVEYMPSNFNELKSVVESVNLLDIDLFANLGDFIRGYQCDQASESRETADKMLDLYKRIKTNKAFVIGNHDDGCLFYSDSTYNDNPNTQQVMFPNEQFNRYVKFGLNNKGTSNYYYSDISGVRVITLYQRDFDYSTDIPQIEDFNIGTDQINWFTNAALNTNLPVIVLTHAPLLQTLYAQSRGGFDAVLSALVSFINNGGTVIAVLSGHTHAQATAKVDGINHIVFKNGYNLFELVSVDLTNRTISCKAINGTTADLSLTY